MPNPYYVQPGVDYSKGLQGLRSSVGEMLERKRKEEEKAEEQRKLEETKRQALAAYNSNDPDAIARFNIANPDMANKMKLADIALHKNEITRENALQSQYDFLAEPTRENVIRLISERKKLLAAEGVPPEQQQETDRFLAMYDEDPKAAVQTVKSKLAAVDTDRYAKYAKLQFPEEQKTTQPTTAMAKYIQDNPNATPEDLVAFTQQLSTAKGAGEKQYSPSPLKKLMDERAALLAEGLPPDHPDIKAYDARISGVDIDIENMTDEEIAYWGAAVNLTGKIPSLGRGKQAAKIRMAIAKSAARQALGADADGVPDAPGKTPAEAALEVVGTQSDTRAIQGSLNFLDKQLSSMGSFVTNLGAQVDQVDQIAKDLETYDTRLLNVPLRAVRGKLKGSALQAKYDLYLSEIESEIGKLATGSTGSVAELSASAQERWAKIHDKNLSINDMRELLKETKHAANLRLESVEDQLERTRKRIRTRDYGTQPAATPTYQEGATATGPGGQKIVFRNGRWEAM